MSRDPIYGMDHFDYTMLPPQEQREVEVAWLNSQLERFARVAVLGALALEAIPHIQGVQAVSAFEKWSHTWITTLTSDDMQFAREVMGIPEPEEAAIGQGDGTGGQG